MVRNIKNYVFPISMVSITTLSMFLLSSSSVLADTSTVSSAKVTVSETCMMTGTVDTPHTATLVNGTYSGTNYSNGIGQTTLKVFCNDNAGFSIYAIGYTNNEYGNNYLHWNKASSNSDHTNDIATGIYQSEATTSSWSMKLAAISGTYAATIDDGVSANNNSTDNFTTWHTVPTEYKRVAYRLSGTDSEQNGQGEGSSITVTYDSYVSGLQPAGTYTGQVKYTMVHPNTHAKPVKPLKPTDCPANSICYAPNADDIIGDMSSLGYTSTLHTASPTAGKISASSNSTADLIAPNYARPGYGFAGWSTSFEANNSSTIYGPNETITTGDLSSNGMILYPVWIASKGDMQEWTGCSGLTAATYDSTTGKVSATLSQLTALTDTRDGNVYTVAKLVDGKCWMVENLRLNNEYTTSAADIAKAQGYGAYSGTGTDYGNFIGLASSENAFFGDSTANLLYSTDGSGNTVNINSANYPEYRIPRYNNNNTNMSANATNSAGTVLIDSHNNNNNHVRWYSYGNYYNWAAAMASTKYYYYFYNTDNTEKNNSDAAGTSICPKGWELPLGYQSNGADRVGSFSYLDMRMGGTGQLQDNSTTPTGTVQVIKWCSFPNNFVYSGIFGNYRGNYGYYWSRSVYGAGSAYILRLERYYFDPGSNTHTKYSGRTVRCIAQ